MDNKIYIVAGARNMQLAQASGGGLWANVGQTTRQVSERLRDDDYKRKAAGGAWKVLFSQNVGDLSDKVIHPILKAHPRVRWENTDNTEEFLFLDDPGDGSEARKIVSKILSSRCLPLLKAENEKLQKEIVSLQERLTIVDDVIGPTGVDVEKIVAAVQEREDLLARLGKSEAAQQELRDRHSVQVSAAAEEARRLQAFKFDLESKVKNQKIFFAVLAAILFLAGRFWAGESHLKDLTKARQERDIAYSAFSTSYIRLKDLQAKMAKVETIQKSESDLAKKVAATPVRQKKQKEKRQEDKAPSRDLSKLSPAGQASYEKFKTALGEAEADAWYDNYTKVMKIDTTANGWLDNEPSPGRIAPVQFTGSVGAVKVSCGDGQRATFVGSMYLIFNKITSCRIETDEGKTAVTIRGAGVVSCAVAGGALTCKAP